MVQGASGTYILRSDVVATVMGEGAVLLDLRTKYFYSANRTAWAILTALESGADIPALKRACEARAAGDGGSAAFFQYLQSEDLIESTATEDWEGELELTGNWINPTLEKHKEPLQRVMMSAFDPTIPLAE